jgi:AraC family transcriptional regulator
MMSPRICHDASSHRPVRVFRTATFELSETHYPPSLLTDGHEHAKTSLVFCLDGRLEERHGAAVGEIQPGSMLVLPREAVHSDRIGPTGCRAVFVSLLQDQVEAFGPLAPVLQVPSFSDNSQLADLGRAFHRELWSEDPFRSVATDGLAWQLLAQLGRDPPARAGSVPGWLARVRDQLHDSPIREHSVVQLAIAAGVHPGHLVRAFTRAYGMPLGRYLRQIRIQRAADHLASTDMPLAQVGNETGFYDQGHFTRAFKAATGLTPGAYRRLHRGHPAEPP